MKITLFSCHLSIFLIPKPNQRTQGCQNGLKLGPVRTELVRLGPIGPIRTKLVTDVQ